MPLIHIQESGRVSNDQNKPGFSWKWRRRMVWLVCLFCMGEIGYIIWRGGGDPVHTAALTPLSLLLGSVVGSYVFGAVWDDNKKGM